MNPESFSRDWFSHRVRAKREAEDAFKAIRRRSIHPTAIRVVAAALIA
ncbi:MAG: hypothetical protein ABIZ81_04165 [Opitutaceae bacterium]